MGNGRVNRSRRMNATFNVRTNATQRRPLTPDEVEEFMGAIRQGDGQAFKFGVVKLSGLEVGHAFLLVAPSLEFPTRLHLIFTQTSNAVLISGHALLRSSHANALGFSSKLGSSPTY
eukprot:414345-Prorocentrum_minimum.AAC.2